jgi:hypothetical protein
MMRLFTWWHPRPHPFSLRPELDEVDIKPDFSWSTACLQPQHVPIPSYIYIISTQSSDCWYNFKRLKMINVFFLSYLSWMIQSFPISHFARTPSSPGEAGGQHPHGRASSQLRRRVLPAQRQSDLRHRCLGADGRGAWNGLETAGLLSWYENDTLW